MKECYKPLVFQKNGQKHHPGSATTPYWFLLWFWSMCVHTHSVNDHDRFTCTTLFVGLLDIIYVHDVTVFLKIYYSLQEESGMRRESWLPGMFVIPACTKNKGYWLMPCSALHFLLWMLQEVGNCQYQLCMPISSYERIAMYIVMCTVAAGMLWFDCRSAVQGKMSGFLSAP